MLALTLPTPAIFGPNLEDDDPHKMLRHWSLASSDVVSIQPKPSNSQRNALGSSSTACLLKNADGNSSPAPSDPSYFIDVNHPDFGRSPSPTSSESSAESFETALERSDASSWAWDEVDDQSPSVLPIFPLHDAQLPPSYVPEDLPNLAPSEPVLAGALPVCEREFSPPDSRESLPVQSPASPTSSGGSFKTAIDSSSSSGSDKTPPLAVRTFPISSEEPAPPRAPGSPSKATPAPPSSSPFKTMINSLRSKGGKREEPSWRPPQIHRKPPANLPPSPALSKPNADSARFRTHGVRSSTRDAKNCQRLAQTPPIGRKHPPLHPRKALVDPASHIANSGSFRRPTIGLVSEPRDVEERQHPPRILPTSYTVSSGSINPSPNVSPPKLHGNGSETPETPESPSFFHEPAAGQSWLEPTKSKSEPALRSSSLFSHPEEEGEPLPPETPVHRGSFVTADIHAAVSEAAALYESTRWDVYWDDSSAPPQISTDFFSLDSLEQLERHYSIIVDAKNALVLRQSAVLIDIGHCLELLGPKVRLYVKDQVTLASVYTDLDYMHRECTNKEVLLNYDGLEWFRSKESSMGLGFVDAKRHQAFDWQERIKEFEAHLGARATALKFIKDPAALLDGRLPRTPFQR